MFDLATMNTTEVVRTVQPELVDVARWSADGSRLVVGVDIFDEDFNEAGSQIAVVDAAGGIGLAADAANRGGRSDIGSDHADLDHAGHTPPHEHPRRLITLTDTRASACPW